MSNSSRLKIVHLLREGPHCVGEIAQAYGLTSTQVSQHLAVLRAHGIVASQRRGSEIVYRLANPKIAHVCDSMRQVLAEQAAANAQMFQAIQEAEFASRSHRKTGV